MWSVSDREVAAALRRRFLRSLHKMISFIEIGDNEHLRAEIKRALLCKRVPFAAESVFFIFM